MRHASLVRSPLKLCAAVICSGTCTGVLDVCLKSGSERPKGKASNQSRLNNKRLQGPFSLSIGAASAAGMHLLGHAVGLHTALIVGNPIGSPKRLCAVPGDRPRYRDALPFDHGWHSRSIIIPLN
ncbi:hypothetical protein GGI43DRAFT_39398 [Trichoderma evansii]